MISTLLILPGDPRKDALLAARRGDDFIITRGDSDALAQSAQRPLALIIPGQAVRAFITDLPATIKSRDRVNVARFAHEDKLGVSPLDVHVVVGAGELAPTAIINPEIMEQMIGASDPAMIVSDFDALADLPTEGSDVVLLDRVVRPGSTGLSLDPDWSEGDAIVVDDEAMARAIFARIDRKAVLNLRAGPYRKRTKIDAGPWMGIAALFIACLVLGLGLRLADIRAKSAQADALNSEARMLYTQMTGQAPPQPLSRLARQAGVSGASSTLFLSLSDQLFDTLSEHPDVSIERLSYDIEEAALRLRLIYPSFEAASEVEQSFATRGTTFVTGGVREQNGVFVGDANLSLLTGAGS